MLCVAVGEGGQPPDVQVALEIARFIRRVTGQARERRMSSQVSSGCRAVLPKLGEKSFLLLSTRLFSLKGEVNRDGTKKLTSALAFKYLTAIDERVSKP